MRRRLARLLRLVREDREGPRPDGYVWLKRVKRIVCFWRKVEDGLT